jgi:hypothetical protein
MQEQEQSVTRNGELTWHKSLGAKWHAYRHGQAVSVCELANRYAATSQLPAGDRLPEGVTYGSLCYWCRHELGMPTRPSKNVPPKDLIQQATAQPQEPPPAPDPLPVINRRQTDHNNHEEMHVEFIGGPFDGVRIILDVVKEPDGVRVLEARYSPRARV